MASRAGGRVRNASMTEVGMGDERVAKVNGRVLFEGGEPGVADDRRPGRLRRRREE